MPRGGDCELQPVGAHEPGVAVIALKELIAEAWLPRRRTRLADRRSCAGRALAASSPRTRIANVLLNPSGLAIVDAVLRVELDAPARAPGVESCGTCCVEHRGHGGAGVLDVHVEVAVAEAAIADERPSEIQLALDADAALGFDRLRDQLAENDLLGEVLRADDDGVRAGARRDTAQASAASSTAAAAPARTTRPVAHRSLSNALLEPAPGGRPTASASAAAGIAPARMVVVSTIDSPRKMYSPRPPAPMAAAMVVVPTPMTVATRMPATIDGSASGNWTMPQQLARRHAHRDAGFDDGRVDASGCR